MKKIVWIMCSAVTLMGLEAHACNFLRRYGANSYITNIPLFFKKQSDFAPQAKTVKYKKGSKVIVENPTILETEVQTDVALENVNATKKRNGRLKKNPNLSQEDTKLPHN